MLRLFRWLIWGDAHLHKWQPYGNKTAVWVGDDDTEKSPPAYRKQSFQCEVCGKIRLFEV